MLSQQLSIWLHIGIGKSVTGAHLANILAELNRDRHIKGCVVYCRPSNKAVDVVHGQLAVKL